MSFLVWLRRLFGRSKTGLDIDDSSLPARLALDLTNLLLNHFVRRRESDQRKAMEEGVYLLHAIVFLVMVACARIEQDASYRFINKFLSHLVAYGRDAAGLWLGVPTESLRAVFESRLEEYLVALVPSDVTSSEALVAALQEAAAIAAEHINDPITPRADTAASLRELAADGLSISLDYLTS